MITIEPAALPVNFVLRAFQGSMVSYLRAKVSTAVQSALSRPALAKFAATSEGKRLMGGGKLPEETEIARWIEDAKGLAKAA